MVLLNSTKMVTEQEQLYNLGGYILMATINEHYTEVSTNLPIQEQTDMAVHSVSPEALKDILGASHDIASDEFWQHESDDVFYCDGDKQTCIDNFLEVYSIRDLLQYCTMYFIPRDSMYYLVMF